MTVDEVLRELRGDYAASSQAQECAARLIESQAAQIEALTAALSKANSQTEHFERHWYLRGDEIEALTKDAARYQVLRRGQHWSTINGIGDMLRGEALDEAIDSAIKAKGTKA